MKETQGALSMLLRRYRLILGKCRLRNALAGLLLGAVLLVPAVSPADSGGKVGRPGYPEGSHYTGTTDGASGPYTADKGHVVISNQAGDLDAKSFYGGHADGKGDVTDNKVEMRGERSRAANIYGGLTENGQASGNRVSVENGRIGGVWPVAASTQASVKPVTRVTIRWRSATATSRAPTPRCLPGMR